MRACTRRSLASSAISKHSRAKRRYCSDFDKPVSLPVAEKNTCRGKAFRLSSICKRLTSRKVRYPTLAGTLANQMMETLGFWLFDAKTIANASLRNIVIRQESSCSQGVSRKPWPARIDQCAVAYRSAMQQTVIVS